MIAQQSINSRAFAYIYRQHLVDNLQAIVAIHPHKKIIVVLKANAYGHGAVEVAKTLDGLCDYFGVASIEEGVELRQAGVYHTKILIFSGFFAATSANTLIEFQLIPVIHSKYQYSYLQEYLQAGFAEIWLKINSGMNRLGIDARTFLDLYGCLSKQAKPIHVMTHLAESENTDQSFSQKQLQFFYSLIKNKKFGNISVFNSAASLLYPFDDQTNTIRVGLALYGSCLLPNKYHHVSLKPVMQLQARIIAIQSVEKNQPVGYNRTYITDKDSQIAIVSIGYGDGYPEKAPTGTPVMINGEIYPTVGKVSMDLIAIDITEATDVEIGSVVTLFGETPTVGNIADKANTSPYAILTAINPRVARIYL